jgi:hypothetical protein
MTRSEEFLLYKSVTMNKQKLNPIEQMPLNNKKKYNGDKQYVYMLFRILPKQKLRWVKSGVIQWFGCLIFNIYFKASTSWILRKSFVAT